MNLVFIAPPAAGKGTISQLLHEKYNLINISAGQLLRDVDPLTEMGELIRKTQKEGKLVDNSITGKLLKARLSKSDVLNGFILDGFPREMPQVDILNSIEGELNLKIDYAIYLTIPFEIALQRTLGRQVCPQCKMTYNKLTGFNKPKKENICDFCGVTLENRNDDNEESLKNRFKLFNETTLPVVNYYRSVNKLIELDGSKDAHDTLNELERRLGLNG